MLETHPARVFKLFLHRENPRHLRCVDERQSDYMRGVELPGATFSVIDGMKKVLGLREQDAWEAAKRHRIPISAHVDTHHHSARGCAYAAIVEHEPELVGAPERVRADERLERARAYGGIISTYYGEHARNSFAILNWFKDSSIDPYGLRLNGVFAFNCDAWAPNAYAAQLDLSKRDTTRFRNHIVEAYKNLIHKKIGIRRIVVLKPGLFEKWQPPEERSRN
jgi:hypothetical protein